MKRRRRRRKRQNGGKKRGKKGAGVKVDEQQRKKGQGSLKIQQLAIQQLGLEAPYSAGPPLKMVRQC